MKQTATIKTNKTGNDAGFRFIQMTQFLKHILKQRK